MSKFFGLIAAALIAVGASSQAQAEINIDFNSIQRATVMEAAVSGLNWKVGDKANYKLSIGGFINGTSNSFVREDNGTSIWMQQDVDLGFMGKQKIEILFNKTTGQIEKILANGQEQQIPSTDGIEIVEMKEANITVPAGKFDCIYVKVKDKSNGQVQEAWMNPQAVPMSGQLKSLGESQFGKVTQELQSFSFATR